MPPTMHCTPYNHLKFSIDPGKPAEIYLPEIKPNLYFFENWWVVWKHWDTGSIVPQVAYPFHSLAKEAAQKCKPSSVLRYKDGKPTKPKYL